MPYTNGDVLARVRMTAASGLIEDEIVNTFAFRHASGLVPNHAAILNLVDAIDAFYNSDDPLPIDKLSIYIGTQVSRAATHKMEFYSILLGGSPFDEVDWLGPGAPQGDENLPTECAGVLSFHGDLTGLVEEVGVTRPKARRRGRVYVGPLRNPAVAGATPACLLNPGFRTSMAFGATSMADLALAAGFTWSVWSRANTELYPVVGGWTDNAPDTQRRRGPASTSRIVWTI